MNELRDMRAQLMVRLAEVPWVGEVVTNGTLDLESYRNYLVSAFRYAKQSPVVMANAGARCINTHPAIGQYFLHHAEEEAGHYLWAHEDLADLGVDDAGIASRWPQTSAASMIAVMHHTASVANPVGLLGWMYLLEAVGEDLGAVGTEGLVSGLDGSPAVRFVGQHAVTDVGHAQEMDAVIEANVTASEDWDSILEVATVVADLYIGMFAEAAIDRS